MPQAKLSSAVPSGFAATGSPYSAKVTATGSPSPALTVTGLPAGLIFNPATGLISGTPTAVSGTSGSTVTVKATNTGGTDSQTFTLRVWQGTGVSVAPSGWSGSANVVAAYPTDALVMAHSTGTTTGSKLTLSSDTATSDAALTTSPAGGSILNAPTECHLATLANGISNGSTLLYYGAASATSAPTWQLAQDTSPLSPVRTNIDPQRLLAPSAQVGCVANPATATRVVATNPGAPTLMWADIANGSATPVWQTIDAPPVAPGVPAPGPIHGAPSLTSRASGEYDLAVTGNDGTAWVRHYTAATGWGAWTSLGGTASSGLSITSEGANNLQVCQRGTDGVLYVDTLTGSSWSGWNRIAGPTLATNTAPAAVAIGGGQTDVLVLGTDNKVYRVHLT